MVYSQRGGSEENNNLFGTIGRAAEPNPNAGIAGEPNANTRGSSPSNVNDATPSSIIDLKVLGDKIQVQWPQVADNVTKYYVYFSKGQQDPAGVVHYNPEVNKDGSLKKTGVNVDPGTPKGSTILFERAFGPNEDWQIEIFAVIGGSQDPISDPIEFTTRYPRCVLPRDIMDVDWNRMYYHLNFDRSSHLLQRLFEKISNYFKTRYPGNIRNQYLATKDFLDNPKVLMDNDTIPPITDFAPLNVKGKISPKSSIQLEVATILFLEPNDPSLTKKFLDIFFNGEVASVREDYFRNGWPGGDIAFNKFKNVLLMDRKMKKLAKKEDPRSQNYKPTLRFLIYGTDDNKFGFIFLFNKPEKPIGAPKFPKDNLLLHLTLPQPFKLYEKAPTQDSELEYHVTDKCHSARPKKEGEATGTHVYYDYETNAMKDLRKQNTPHPHYGPLVTFLENSVEYKGGPIVYKTGRRVYRQEENKHSYEQKDALTPEEAQKLPEGTWTAVKGKYENLPFIGNANGEQLNILGNRFFNSGFYINSDGSAYKQIGKNSDKTVNEQGVLQADNTYLFSDGAKLYQDGRVEIGVKTLLPNRWVKYVWKNFEEHPKNAGLKRDIATKRIYRHVKGPDGIENHKVYMKESLLEYPGGATQRIRGKKPGLKLVVMENNDVLLINDAQVLYFKRNLSDTTKEYSNGVRISFANDGLLLKPKRQVESFYEYDDGTLLSSNGTLHKPLRTLEGGIYVYAYGVLLLPDGFLWRPTRDFLATSGKKVWDYGNGYYLEEGGPLSYYPPSTARGGFKKTRKTKHTKRRKSSGTRRRG